jgi:1,4-alpha-glucan branching enzyme
MPKTEPFISNLDEYLFAEGTHLRTYEKLGAHFAEVDGVRGIQFSVWAPNARRVSVVGDFNNWDETQAPMESVASTGVWTAFVPGVTQGQSYKFSIHSHVNNYHMLKIDPYAFYAEAPPRSASVVWSLEGYEWSDEKWMSERQERQAHDKPLSTYEVHLGSWRRNPNENNRSLTYREMADELVEYVTYMEFTHVEFLPVTEHPFDGSWGYQSLSYFAPTSRFGTPQDFMYLVDRLHQAGIGVIVDWVPAHFPVDEHGLGFYDGTHLFEHADERQGFHPDWKTYIFNFGRTEVANFLLASALFWFEKYHIDGVRVDAVASMLYLDYSRKDGEWIPNEYGGNENLAAINFIKRFNEVVHEKHPGVITIAEESTAWPMVSRPTYLGGLGFGFKWNMGWMHDMLEYFAKDPVHRHYHHNNLTFGLLYAFQENFVLPLSHDEVVHGKGSLLSKMPGDPWQKFANLRLLYSYMWAHPGKKLLFMGGELGQWTEWNSADSLPWHLVEEPSHQGVQRIVKDLNSVLAAEPALHSVDFESSGFRWIDCNDSSQSVLSFIRHAEDSRDAVVCVFNFTPVPRYEYRVGVPHDGYWLELLNSDASIYHGSGLGNMGGVVADSHAMHGLPYSISLTLPPLAALFFRLNKNE